MNKTKPFDVLAVNLSTRKVRFMAQDKTQSNAEAVVEMAVMRRGVDEEFFVAVEHGTYKDGDVWAEKPS